MHIFMFLQKEMFELREHLEDLKTKEEFDAAEVDLKVKLGAIEQCLSGCFETQNLPEAASQVVKLQYMTKVVPDLLVGLFPGSSLLTMLFT